MDNRWIDPEIDALFAGDPELTELAHRVRAARPEPPLDPRFVSVLRAQLMREAPAILGAGAGARPERVRAERPRTIRTRRTGWWQQLSPRFAWGGAVFGIALVGAAVLLARTPMQDRQVTAASPVADFHAVSPTNVITVAFNEPMNEAAVVAGLHIRPATEVTTSWQGNNLLITPTHHLAGNTPYTVTIDRSATRSAGGSLAASDIHIAFGTAPTPPVGPSVTELTPAALASVTSGAQLIATGDGTVIATSSSATPTTPATVTPAASASASSSSTSSPRPSASASPSSSASPSGSVAPSTSVGEMVAMTSGRGVIDLGPAASSAALAPDGLRLVAAVPADSGSTVELVSVDGSDRRTLTTLASTVLATGWESGGTALVAEPDRIVTVDLLGHVSTLTMLPANTTRVVFSPDGSQAFAGSTNADGQLVDLSSSGAHSRPLTGSRQVAAFSGDSSVVAWIDTSSGPAHLVTSPVARDAAATVPLDHSGNDIAAIAVDRTGSHVAIADQPPTDGGELQVLALPSGTVVAHAAQAQAPVYSARGDLIAYISGGIAQVATVPGAVAGTVVNALPDGAAGALKAFVDAQIQGNAATLATLSAAGVDTAGSTPHGLSRGYVISAVANLDGTVAATARLIVDPSAAHPAASFADESLTLSPKDGGGYVVSALTTGHLSDEPIGPQVLSVVPVTGPTLVMRVSFDSDLRAASVPGAITVTTLSGRTLQVTTVYDANTRTATVTTTVPANTKVTLTVATSLVDVDGQALASGFTTPTGG